MMGNYRKSDNSGYYVKFQPPLDGFPTDDDLKDATLVNQMIEAAISEAHTDALKPSPVCQNLHSMASKQR